MANFAFLPQIVKVFEFQGWNDFLSISEDVYTGVVGAFYSTLASVHEDNTSLRSIIRSFEIQVLPSDLVQITNTPNEGILCRGGVKWWEQLGATEEEVSKVLTGRRDMQVRNIRTSNLLTTVRAVYSVVQYTVLPRMGNTNVMTEVDQMVMFCLMTRRRINLVRLVSDYMLSAIDEARKSHVAVPYGMLLTKVFARAQLPIDGQRKDEKCLTTTKKTFSTMGLKLQDLDIEGKKKEKKKEKGREEN